MASKSEANNDSADKSHIIKTNVETNSSGGPSDLCVASVAKMDEDGGQEVKPMPNQSSSRTSGLDKMEPGPVKIYTPLESESDSAEPVNSNGDCEGGSTKPAKKVDRRQQRHTASTTSYVPRDLSAETKSNPLLENIGSSEPNRGIDLSDKDSRVPKFERVRSICGNVEVSKSLAPGEEESDDVMSCEDAEPSESDGVSKVAELTQSVNDIPRVISTQPVLFQEESLLSAPTTESVLEGSSIESESISGTSESLSSVNKVVREEEGDTRDCEMMTGKKEGEEGDEKEAPEGEEGIEDEADDQNEDKENLEEEAKDSLGKLEDTTPKKKKTRRGSIGFGVIPSGQDALIMGQPGGQFPPEKLFEYQWPQDKGDFFMLQEQISEYLGVKSFKRKYPDLPRKTVDIMERNFLKDKGIVTEMQCDLGLTAVRSEDVLDLMQRDYEDKYKEYTLVLQEREKQKMKEKTKGYEQLSKELLQPNVEKSKMTAFIKKAVKSAAEFNSQFMRELREDRRAYYDLQTQDIQFPLGRCKRLSKEATKVGAYPVAVIPGQYQDYYKKYSPHELKYFPLNSAIYGPPKKFNTIFADPNEPTDSESEGSVASHTSSGSGSGSDTGSSGHSLNQETPMDTNAAGDETGAQDIKPEPDAEGPKCKMCEEVKVDGQEEELVMCSECKGGSHPSCLELTPAMVEIIKTYPWQCMECKTCVECMDPGDEDKMMFCDQCDRGYHTFCVGLQRIPGGKWECHSCRKIEPPTPIKKKRKYERKPKVEDGEDNEEKGTKKVKREKKEKKETPVKVKKEKKDKVAKAEAPATEKKERKRRERKEKPKKE